MTIEETIYNILIANTDLAAIVSDRIYPMNGDESGSSPYLTYEVLSEVVDYDFTQAIDLQDVRFQITAWSNSYLTTTHLKNAIKLALSNYTGFDPATMIDIPVIFFQGSNDVLNLDAGNDEDKVFGKQTEFMVWFKSTDPFSSMSSEISSSSSSEFSSSSSSANIAPSSDSSEVSSSSSSEISSSSSSGVSSSSSSQEALLGPELVINGGFSTGDLTGWNDIQNVYTVVSNQAVGDGTQASNANFVNSATVTIGRTYQVSCDVISISSGEYRFFDGDTPYDFSSGAGLGKTLIFTAAGVDINFFVGAGISVTVDNLSVREIL